MVSSTYLPRSESGKVIWIKNFSGKLPLYATLLSVTTAESTSVTADAAMVEYAFDRSEASKNELAERIEYKNILLKGDPATPIGAYPLAADAGTPPATVGAGVFKRIGKLVQRIKNHPNYTSAIGEDLGIENHASTVVNGKPDLKVTLSAGKPVLKWTKGTSDALDIYVNRGDGKNFVFLATIMGTTYTDATPIPAGTAMVQWTYKGIYKMSDQQTGEFSNPVTIVVMNNLP